MNDAGTARQQIVDKIKQSSNILVTVSTDPSVDELSAALGLTMMLNKLNKHATAVVSGAIPPAITFLEPDKIFEGTVDSLRDFIIALDKEKADHLRYKVDGDVVKIFITPYKTTITEAELDFSQGDYNVELVLALGVKDSDHLDKALEAHGRILHDATVATVSAGTESSNLGSIDWKDDSASSLSEMLVSLSEAIKGDKPLLDEQIATALLTGIVAATDRFSSNTTSSKVMTMAAQLMAAGANQQLIAAKLEDAQEIAPEVEESEEIASPSNSDGTTTLSEDKPTKVDKEPAKKVEEEEPGEPKTESAAGTLAISHEPAGTLDEVAAQVADVQTKDAAEAAEQKLESELSATLPPIAEPILGSALNATTEQAADDARKELADDRNKTILNHDSGHAAPDNVPAEEPRFGSPFNAAAQVDTGEPPTVDPFAQQPLKSVSNEAVLPDVTPTLADIDATNRVPHDDARAAIDAAFDAAPPQDISGLPPLPDFSTLPPLPPPLPDFSQPAPEAEQPSGAVPPEKLADIFAPEPTKVPPKDQATDPGQFTIPGQQQ